MARRRRWAWAPGLAALGLACVAAVPPGERVRVEYSAPPGCPPAEEFLAQVRARVGSEWEAPAGELARTIEVRVSSEPDRSVARIEFVDENGGPIVRSVSGATCAEAVSGIALVTALAIESRVSDAVRESEPGDAVSSPPSLAAPPAESAPAAAPEKPASPEPPPSAVLRAAPPPGVSARPRFEVGGAAMVSAGVGPELAWGPRGFVGFGWTRGPDFRLSVDVLSTGMVETKGGGLARFSLLSSSLAGCPVAFVLGAQGRVLPCGGLSAGFLQAGGIETTRFPKVDSNSPGWLAAVLGVRAELVFEIVLVELGIEGRIPFGYRRFVFTDPAGGPDVEVYRVPAFAVGGHGAIGLRL